MRDDAIRRRKKNRAGLRKSADGGRGHKLIKKIGARTFIKFGTYVGIHSYSTSIRKKSVGIRGILLKNWGGIRVVGKVFVYFFDFLKMFEYFFEYFRILWDALEYFGILWDTLVYFEILCTLRNTDEKMEGIPIKKWNTKGYLLRVNPEYFSNTLFEYHGIPIKYPRISGYSRGIPRIPLNTSQKSSNTIEYYEILSLQNLGIKQ